MFSGNTSPSNTNLLILENALSMIFWLNFFKLYFFVSWVALVTFVLIFQQINRKILTIISAWAIILISFHFTTSKLLTQQYLIVFENQVVPESEIYRPLKKAGYNVCELLNEKIINWDYPNRRYAISMLGKYKYEPAIGNLKKILYSDAEKFYIKCDCIQALEEINNAESLQIVSIYKNKLDPKNDSLIINYLKLSVN